MRSVQDQNVHKIAIADGSTGHIAVTTPWYEQPTQQSKKNAHGS